MHLSIWFTWFAIIEIELGKGYFILIKQWVLTSFNLQKNQFKNIFTVMTGLESNVKSQDKIERNKFTFKACAGIHLMLN